MFRVAAAKFVRPAASRAYCIPITNVCREWRCKVDGEATAEKLEKIVDETKSSLPKGATVQRLVCKAEWDYKILTSVPLATFGAWKEESFAPEADVLAKLKATEGVTEVTAQAYVVDVL